MPLKTSYSESELADFMVAQLSATGAALGLTDSSAGIASAVLATARLLGDDIADLTDMALLEAAARWQAWMAAEAAAVNQYDLKAGTSSLTRSQLFEHIQTRLARARSDWYAAQVAANGTTSMFAFTVAHGCRGR